MASIHMDLIFTFLSKFDNFDVISLPGFGVTQISTMIHHSNNFD